jgi:hypothetical protein
MTGWKLKMHTLPQNQTLQPQILNTRQRLTTLCNIYNQILQELVIKHLICGKVVGYQKSL